jgi:hypothetical protein
LKEKIAPSEDKQKKNILKRSGFTALYIFNILINIWQAFVGSGF